MGTKRKYHGDHGLFSRLYTIWKGMHLRCRYPSHAGYFRYGGRGIEVCDGWFEYISFRDWAITNGYNESLTLDRIDNEKGYFPENCRWVTVKEQANNRRKSVSIEIFGESKNIKDWARDERCKVGANTFYRRFKSGMDPEEALTAPLAKPYTYNGPAIMTAFGESKTVTEWSKDDRCKVSAERLFYRYHKKMEPEKAITTPPKSLTNPNDTHCAKGHFFDENNTNITKQGYRRCRECDREKEKRRVRDRRKKTLYAVEV